MLGNRKSAEGETQNVTRDHREDGKPDSVTGSAAKGKLARRVSDLVGSRPRSYPNCGCGVSNWKGCAGIG
jgi:hypothetical protein